MGRRGWVPGTVTRGGGDATREGGSCCLIKGRRNKEGLTSLRESPQSATTVGVSDVVRRRAKTPLWRGRPAASEREPRAGGASGELRGSFGPPRRGPPPERGKLGPRSVCLELKTLQRVGVEKSLNLKPWCVPAAGAAGGAGLTGGLQRPRPLCGPRGLRWGRGGGGFAERSGRLWKVRRWME